MIKGIIMTHLMTLDEAIEHAEEMSCGEDICSENHKQLVEWLKELRQVRYSKALQSEYDRDLKETEQACASLRKLSAKQLKEKYDLVLPPCDVCGEPSVISAIDTCAVVYHNVKYYPVGPVKYGCEFHPVESIFVGYICQVG